MRSDLTAAARNTNGRESFDRLPYASERGTFSDANAGSRTRGFPALGAYYASVLLATVALPAHAAASDASDTNGQLQEVIVTAEKKSERLQDVPIPLTVIDAASLVERNEVRLQDFYSAFPGFSIDYAQQSAVNIVVRGLPAAITIDDIPLSIATSLEQAGGDAFDLDPGGLAQVDLLRGPQGTLYGADSEGGLLRYVTKDPTTDHFSGHWDAGVSHISNGAQPGWNFRGSANVPVSGDLGVLADGFVRQDPGYIDNPTLGAKGVNESHTYGAHLGGLWHPTDALSVKLGAFIQEARGHGSSDVDVLPGLGQYDQNYIAGSGPYWRMSQLYDATIKYTVGAFELTSVTGYVWTGFNDSFDNAASGLGPILQSGVPGSGFNGFGQPGLLQPESAHSSSFSQELRLATHIGKFLDILFGGFYNYAYGTYSQSLIATNPQTGAAAGDFSDITFALASRSYAAFANLTFHFTDKLQLQLGGREERDYSYNYGTSFAGPANPIFGVGTTADKVIVPGLPGESQKFTFLVTPQYKFSPDVMAYVRVASGYTPGSPNPELPGVPPESKPDTVINYEVGAKAELWDHRWSVDASAYHIKHDDIQQGLVIPGSNFFYTGNAGTARVDGVELSTDLRPATGLHVGGWIAWDESKLTDMPATSNLAGYQGQELPFLPKYSGNLSVEQQFPVSDSTTAFAGADWTYIGSRKDAFTGGSQGRLAFPSYTKTGLHAGVNYNDWTARLYVNNLTDSRGIINGGPSTIIPYSYYYITPRVIGLQVSKKF